MKMKTVYPIPHWLLSCVGLPFILVVLGFALVVSIDADVLVFDHAHLWWLGGAGVLAGWILLYGVYQRRNALHRFTSDQLAPLLTAGISPGRQALRAGMLVTAVMLIAAGIIGPRWGVQLQEQKVRGIDIMVALDVSRSMLAEDVQPNRLERGKREIRQQLIERAVFQNLGRVGLLAFAGSASLKVPLTTDYVTFQHRLDDITVGSAPRGGTAIGEAIRAATDLFARSPEKATKIIVLFSDGEDHEGRPADAAKDAFEEFGVRTYIIGVGDPSLTAGAQIPIRKGDAVRPLLHDGQIVFSRLDGEGLRAIAAAGHGQFAIIDDFHRLVDALRGLHRTHLATEERILHIARYQWFIAAALLLLLLEPMIRDRRTMTGRFPRRIWEVETA